ncbi:DNA internalization-related competence protein ComEC/Rec2 [Methylonatrum kenyense]|uniref:DNA internalization-related competence protein ComEC/Rec2 n=1 Tax=Methylonatrum kenyense TaxID=455253 RepID=UPI0020BE0630|nr:DNA internalization-related competence protein ComEC/Rec2 [Methylonatrum kenyense]MCK8516480.1 DNA internalization-related competence protein ComEC/Rec2 [Methylonatrum kenyense]
MPALLLAFATGLLLVHLLPVLPSPWIGAGLLPLLPFRHHRVIRLSMAVLAGLFAGILVLQPQVAAWQIPASQWGGSAVSGSVVSIPRLRGESLEFQFRPDRTAVTPERARILVRWYRPSVDVPAGSRWQLDLRTRSTAAPRNPGGVDMERYWRSQRLAAIGSVQTNSDNRQLAPPRGLHAWRQQLGETLRHRISRTDGSALAVALLVGDRQHLSPDLRETLIVTGTAHLIAISGLHVGLVAAAVWAVAAALWRFLPVLPGRVPCHLAGVPPALLAAGGYAALAGFALPTQRALIMLCLAMLLLAARRLRASWAILLTAFCLVLLLDPLAPLSPGLWLSFGAVLSLYLLLADRPLPPTAWQQFLRVQVALLFALLPLTLFWFGRIAWLSPLANLVAVPLVGGLVVPLLMLGAALGLIWDAGGTFLLQWGAWLLELLVSTLTMLQGWSPAERRPGPPAWLLLLALPTALALLLPLGLVRRLALLLILAVPVSWQAPAPPSGQARVTVLDLGHAHASIVRTRRHALLFDAGHRHQAVILRSALRQQGISALDRLVVSNQRAGSEGGRERLTLPVESGVGHGFDRACGEVDAWHWDGVDFRFLDPGAGNDCLLRVTASGERLLLAHGTEQPITSHVHSLAAPRIDWLVLPAHGHRQGLPQGGETGLSPIAAIVPVDKRNRFGLPHAEVREHWQARGSRLLTTGERGAITLQLGSGRTVRASRDADRAWWRSRSGQPE